MAPTGIAHMPPGPKSQPANDEGVLIRAVVRPFVAGMGVTERAAALSWAAVASTTNGLRLRPALSSRANLGAFRFSRGRFQTISLYHAVFASEQLTL